MEYNELFARTELLIGREAMQSLATKKVILFGVGGVGSWCAEGLIRSGIMHLTMVDSDRVATANINRQLPATTQTVGELKVEVLKKRLQEINPHATINALPEIYSEESSPSFHLEQYDYVIDAIDSLGHKAHLLTTAAQSNATIFSSMGAALKIDPQQIKVAEFWKVRGCKLASALRERLRKGLKLQKPILCVYSEERLPNIGQEALSDANENGSFRKAQTNGTMVQVTAVFGFTLSGLVIQDIVKVKNELNFTN
ncbi:tRNA threonylcarbamoyladenosine dehydratase [Proteiniphilum sp.]|uniref:tRNA threonylcarbamoyladenosine dehydratase n=1 Tax=Proteiniphilum sp. TaxID=1926877 RepID=UPI002B20C8ED|nr:tRNA threonylcarbamoyladenosine dehydratase [Proteiniphilum sp.]MEA4915916.1 tRNA threonylcarbamoyladenosine dehydratase [Proteiniphilum sp.]MEA4949799.1 tRNA threonylcarbamoyladenosine dehydratase [Petrimonas sp.]